MEFKVTYTKFFNGCLRALQQQGHKKSVQAVRAAISEAGMNGEITLPRTKHGESRISNVEKYDLPDAHRLVVQLVDGVAKTRAFLFCGSHDDSDRWLDNHYNYRWVRSTTDGTLEFVQVTENKDERHVPFDRFDLESPENLLELPLLRVLSPEEWRLLSLPPEAQELASTVLGSDYERDAEGILERLDQLAGYNSATVVLDLLVLAHAGDWSALQRRMSIVSNDAAVVSPSEAAAVMLENQNSESFVTFDEPDDLDKFFDKHSLADWMLFLHPEQKKIVERDFRGPARLRGVSGSGKTCVLVHRARYLAKKYRQPIFLVTLTESMRKLLDHLADDLCGVGRSLINTTTMSALARFVAEEVSQSPKSYSIISDDRQKILISEVLERIRKHPDFSRTPLHPLGHDDLCEFLRDEIEYVRSRLRGMELDRYIDTQTFQRRGLELGLSEVARRVVLEGIRFYDEQLTSEGLLDHEGRVAEALNALDEPRQHFNKARCILCDEVQDLSQLELALIGRLPTPNGERIASAENALFLAGDGAQTIYKRGFTLRTLGIDVSSRSFTLKKNYRNTHEILKAAFGLVARYEFADVDEEDTVKPSAPEFAKRHGPRPTIVRCSSLSDEAVTVATAIQSLLAKGRTPGQICVVGPSVKTREEV